MLDPDSIARQEQADREYLAACRVHGIEPALPTYRGEGTKDDLIELHASQQDAATKNGSGFLVTRAEPEPLKQLPPEAEAVSRTLEIILPHKTDASTFVQTAGRRCLALAWLLGKRPEPLAELARKLGCSRAALSSYVRCLEDSTGLHGRGQKAASTRAIYRDNARRSWKLRKLDTALAAAASPQ
jgi:hypothetical protein